MAKYSCPNCGALGEEGSVCEFCGTTIINPNRSNIQSSKRNNIAKDTPILIYETDLTPDQVIKSAKQFVRNDLDTNLMGSYQKYYDEFIVPIGDKADLFSYNVERFEVPLYWYQFEAQERGTDSVVWHDFFAIADKDNSFPEVVSSELRYEELYDFENEFGLTLKESVKNQDKYENLFNIGEYDIWRSIYASKKRDEYFRRYENRPVVKMIIIPIYVVNIKVNTLIGKGVKSVNMQCIIGRDGNVYGAYDSNFRCLLAEYFLGDDWLSIIKNREKAADEEKHREYEREEQNKNRIGTIMLVVGIIVLFGSFWSLFSNSDISIWLGGMIISIIFIVGSLLFFDLSD